MSEIGKLIIDRLVEWGVNEALANLLLIVIGVILWIIFGIIATRMVKVVIARVLKVNKKGPRAVTVSKLVSNVFKYIIWFIVVLMILSEFNVDLTPFIASAGVVGIAIGFGAQEIVKDFLSGFFIIFEDTFNVGDVVEIDGFKGNVLSLGLRTTIIENWLGERKMISNGKIGSIINFSKNDSIAVVKFGVSYDTDLEKLASLMTPFLESTKSKYSDIVETPKFLGVTELADSSINMMVIAKTYTMKHFQVERDIRKDLVIYLTNNQIEIPFPQVVLHNV